MNILVCNSGSSSLKFSLFEAKGLDDIRAAKHVPPGILQVAAFDVDNKRFQLYSDQDAWARKAILNVAASGECSSHPKIAEYAKEKIWNAKPCPLS